MVTKILLSMQARFYQDNEGIASASEAVAFSLAHTVLQKCYFRFRMQCLYGHTVILDHTGLAAPETLQQ